MNKKKIYVPIVIAAAFLLPSTALAAEITVSSGDTLYSIAKKSSTTVDALKKLNNLSSNTLYIGQKLKTSNDNYATVVNAQLLNVRSGPGTSYSILTTVKGGEQVKVISTHNTWKKVEINGKTGYVSDYYLKDTKVNVQSATEYIGTASGLFRTPGKDKVSSLSPQRVTVLERGSDGWLKINTWLGPLWIKNGITQEVAQIDYVYITKTSGLFKTPGSDKVSSLAPQRVIALERGKDGWIRINTWLGQMWIKDGVTVEPAKINYAYITKTSGLFKGQGKDKVSSIAPQRVVVLETGVHGWIKINTWLGQLWVNDGVLNEEVPTVTAPVNQVVYTVVSGDNLSRIAVKYNTTVPAIQNLNGLKTTVLAIGQKLKIPTAGVIASAKIFSMPVEGSYQKTSDFGLRWGTQHYGTDFSRWGDVKILAAADGVVSKSESHSSYGEVIYIKHVIAGKSYETLYAHMREDSRAVKVGDTVKVGQFIGWMGTTGRSTGQHLHFEVHLGKYTYGQGSAVDPMLYLK